MKKKNVIATLNVGRKWEGNFEFHFLPSWDSYCQRHGIQLVNLTRNLDDTERAGSRSPSWQKLLVHKASELQKYERIAWIDSDVLIRPDAPNIFDASPVEKVGAVDDFGTPNREDHDLMMDALYRKWDAENIAYISNRTPAEYYENYGISCSLDSVVQAGVMVYTPEIHGKLFEKVYQNYEEGASPALNHEMRPLSYELLSAGLVHWISPKFNMQWSYYRQLYYPFLDDEKTFDVLKWPKISTYQKVLSSSVNTAFQNNYFLHFAGRNKDYRFIAPIR